MPFGDGMLGSAGSSSSTGFSNANAVRSSSPLFAADQKNIEDVANKITEIYSQQQKLKQQLELIEKELGVEIRKPESKEKIEKLKELNEDKAIILEQLKQLIASNKSLLNSFLSHRPNKQLPAFSLARQILIESYSPLAVTKINTLKIDQQMAICDQFLELHRKLQQESDENKKAEFDFECRTFFFEFHPVIFNILLNILYKKANSKEDPDYKKLHQLDKIVKSFVDRLAEEYKIFKDNIIRMVEFECCEDPNDPLYIAKKLSEMVKEHIRSHDLSKALESLDGYLLRSLALLTPAGARFDIRRTESLYERQELEKRINFGYVLLYWQLGSCDLRIAEIFCNKEDIDLANLLHQKTEQIVTKQVKKGLRISPFDTCGNFLIYKNLYALKKLLRALENSVAEFPFMQSVYLYWLKLGINTTTITGMVIGCFELIRCSFKKTPKVYHIRLAKEILCKMDEAFSQAWHPLHSELLNAIYSFYLLAKIRFETLQSSNAETTQADKKRLQELGEEAIRRFDRAHQAESLINAELAFTHGEETYNKILAVLCGDIPTSYITANVVKNEFIRCLDVLQLGINVKSALQKTHGALSKSEVNEDESDNQEQPTRANHRL